MRKIWNVEDLMKFCEKLVDGHQTVPYQPGAQNRTEQICLFGVLIQRQYIDYFPLPREELSLVRREGGGSTVW